MSVPQLTVYTCIRKNWVKYITVRMIHNLFLCWPLTRVHDALNGERLSTWQQCTMMNTYWKNGECSMKNTQWQIHIDEYTMTIEFKFIITIQMPFPELTFHLMHCTELTSSTTNYYFSSSENTYCITQKCEDWKQSYNWMNVHTSNTSKKLD